MRLLTSLSHCILLHQITLFETLQDSICVIVDCQHLRVEVKGSLQVVLYLHTMANVERRVRSLTSEDGDMKEAIETVLDTAENSDDSEVKWVDVREDLTSGQWGRLIEKGILEDGNAGFELSDPESTREGLSTDPELAESDFDEDIESNSWTTYDKLAGVVTMGFFAGYMFDPVRSAIGGVIDVALGPLMGVAPFYLVIMVIALFTGIYSTLLRAGLMDMDTVGKYQDRMKDIKQRREKAKERDDQEALDAIQEEQMDAMGDQLGMFKEQFRPMVWIMFLTIPAFLWMFWVVGYRGTEAQYPAIAAAEMVVPLAGTVSWDATLVGPIQLWIVWYFLCSMAFTQIVQKSLNIDMSPSAS